MAVRNRVGNWHGIRSMDQCVESFWSQVDKTGDCWIWFGNRNRRGYGQYKMPGMSYRTHRSSWEMHNGPIPKGIHVLHHCDNPSCVNPSHLFLGTHTDNMHDASVKGRIKAPLLRGEAATNVKLKAWQVRRIRILAGFCTHGQISKWFGIARSVVTRIIHRQLWRYEP